VHPFKKAAESIKSLSSGLLGAGNGIRTHEHLRDWTLNPTFARTFGPRSLDSDFLTSCHKLRLDAPNCCLVRHKNVKAEDKNHMEDSK
jgi:hypothetical protein